MSRREVVTAVVECAKLKQELPALKRPPFPGEFGKRIYDNISQAAWDMWTQQSSLIINHYSLNLADPRAQEALMAEMESFLFDDKEERPEGWSPEGAQEAAPSAKGAAPAAKGAPRRK